MTLTRKHFEPKHIMALQDRLRSITASLKETEALLVSVVNANIALEHALAISKSKTTALQIQLHGERKANGLAQLPIKKPMVQGFFTAKQTLGPRSLEKITMKKINWRPAGSVPSPIGLSRAPRPFK